MERNPPVRPSIRASVLVVLAFGALLAGELSAQVPLTFNVPSQTAERIVTAQILACQVAETASGAELDGLDLALQRMIQQAENEVRRAAADSAPAIAAQKTVAESEAKLKPLEAQLDPLLVRANEINSAQKIYEDSMAVAARGNAEPGGATQLEQLEASMKSLDDQHARFASEAAKITDADNWLQGRDEQLKHDMVENRTKWRQARDERRDIVRRIHTARYNPAYQNLVQEEEALDQRIQRLREQIDPLKEARDAAKKRLGDFNLEAIRNLEQLHEINGFLHQYLSYARDCVERRRGQLAQNVPPPVVAQPGTLPPEDVLTGTASGRWSGGCKYQAEGYVPGRPLTIGGTVSFQFDGANGVSGTFLASDADFGVTSFPVVATLRPDPDPSTGRRAWVENGTGAGTGWSGTWQGRFGTIDGQFTGHGFNAPILKIQTSQWGEAECVATWSVP